MSTDRAFALCLLLLFGALTGASPAESARNSSASSTVQFVRQEITMMSGNYSAVYKEAMRVLEVDGCRAAVQKAAGSKARFLLEPLLCWRNGMERLLCPGFDYMRSRHFLRVPVLLTDPALPVRVKRMLRELYPTSLGFMNAQSIQFQLATTHPSVKIELESQQLGSAGGRLYLLLRAYCNTAEHCQDMRRGIASQPSLFFETLRLSLNSSDYPGLKRSVRSVSTGPYECRTERLGETVGSGGDEAGSQIQAAEAVNQTSVVEVKGQLYFLVQQRSSGRVSFQRTWSDYEKGFGDPADDYWMGLRLLHSLTKKNRVLRVEMVRHRSSTFTRDLFHAEYSNFRVGPPPAYVMTYTALDKARSSVALDALAESRGRAFSTLDRDNDRWGQSCSRVRGGSGGWWFNSCGKCNPNGLMFVESGARNESGIRWEHLDSRALSGNETLKFIRLLLLI